MSDIAYFDNAATTFPKPEAVYRFMDNFYRECGVNAGRGQHKLSARANALIDETRELILDLFHCSNKSVVFTKTATESLNLILSGIIINSGCTVYISPFEHNAVTRMLHHLQKSIDFCIEILSVDRDSKNYNIQKISKQFSEKKPECIIVSHASNVCGVVAPINEIFTEGKKYNAVTVVDMCQTAGLIDTDLSSDIFDYAVFEGHKTLYAPMGIGGFICKPSTDIKPLVYGGTGVESANQDMPDEVPVKYEAGSHNILAIAGLNASVKWINEKGISHIYETECENRRKIIEVLNSFENITVIDPDSSIGVVSCVFDGYSSDDIGYVLSNHDIAVRTGLHCSPYAHKFLGTFPAGTVRFSVSYFNDEKDFGKLAEALKYIEENS